ncbi:hypothetical protein RBWH47_03755 [Rhodopirellula baltica WH47]|uniref:Uncharacterized protein n=1 Tax=Rhodopirellula baltica WH47 TaxID=991778 RepID=F2AXH9_RHOBT|nr:hypothetical protein RBWH47_03755 [Rhodopirellula baltica WH47]
MFLYGLQRERCCGSEVKVSDVQRRYEILQRILAVRSNICERGW